MEIKKATVSITLNIELVLNKEQPHHLVSRLEEEVRSHIHMGMLAANHSQEAHVTNVELNTVIEEL